MENRKLKVFLCYSRSDKTKVRKLYSRLIKDGFDVWFDVVNLMPGHDWDLEIMKAVKGSDTVVVCLSKSSITKEGYVQKEITSALNIADEKPEGTIFIIPAQLENCEVPSRISRFQIVELFKKSGYSQLKKSLHFRMDDLNIRFDSNEISSKNNQNMAKIPMLGEIDSSTPALIEDSSRATDNEKESIEIAQSLLPSWRTQNNLFALRVRGSSLIDALINDGDIVILKPTESVKNGEMAVVWLSDRKEITLKYFFKEKDGYILQPANPEFKPIKVNKSEKIEVRGKVVMVIRKR